MIFFEQEATNGCGGIVWKEADLIEWVKEICNYNEQVRSGKLKTFCYFISLFNNDADQ